MHDAKDEGAERDEDDSEDDIAPVGDKAKTEDAVCTGVHACGVGGADREEGHDGRTKKRWRAASGIGLFGFGEKRWRGMMSTGSTAGV